MVSTNIDDCRMFFFSRDFEGFVVVSNGGFLAVFGWFSYDFGFCSGFARIYMYRIYQDFIVVV